MGSGKSRTIRPGIVQQPMAPMIAAPVPCVQPMPIISQPYCPQPYVPIPQNIVYGGGGGAGMIAGGPCGPNQWQKSDFSRAYSENVSQIPLQQQQQQLLPPPQQICFPQQQQQAQICPMPIPVPQPYPMPIPQPCLMPMPAPCPVPCPVPPSCTMQQPCPGPPMFPCPPSQACGPMMPLPPIPPSFGGNQQFGGGFGGNPQFGSQGFQPFDQGYTTTPSFNPQTNTFAVDYGRSSFTPWSTATRYTQ